MAKKQSKSQKKISAAFHEVFHDKPRTVDTSKSAEGQRKQMVAISLSKARRAGARIPNRDQGGLSPEGPVQLLKGEKVNGKEVKSNSIHYMRGGEEVTPALEYRGKDASGIPMDDETLAASAPADFDNNVPVNSPEMQRRKNNMVRDRHTGFKVTRNVAYATPEGKNS